MRLPLSYQITMPESDIKKLNHYDAGSDKIDGILTGFQKEKIAFIGTQQGLKSFVSIEDRPIDKAIFQMEAVLNHERGHVNDPSYGFKKEVEREFSIPVSVINGNGVPIIAATDLMEKYAEIESFATSNDDGTELMYANLTLTNVDGGVATLSVSKSTGNYIGQNLTGALSDYVFPSIQPSVHAITTLNYSGVCGMQLINEHLFVSQDNCYECANGQNIWFTNFSDDNNIGNMISVGTYATDPVYGYGRWGLDKHLIYYNYTSWGEMLNYQTLNQYLDGTRYIYNWYSSKLVPGLAIVGWLIEWGSWPLYDSYGFPTYQCEAWIKRTTAEYYCMMPR